MRSFLQVWTAFALLSHSQITMASEPHWTISGQTAFPAMVQAELRLKLGNDEYLSQTDAEGRFSLTVPVPGPSALVRLEVHGQDPQQGLSHARLVGSGSDLGQLAQAGDNNIELGQISPVSSVVYVLAEQGAGGQLPDHFDQLAPTLRVLDVASFQHLVRAHMAITTELMALPDGVEHSLDLLRDPNLVLDLLRALTESPSHWYATDHGLNEMHRDLVLTRPGMTPPFDVLTHTGTFHIPSSSRLRVDSQGLTGHLVARNYDGAVTISGLTDPGSIWADRFEQSTVTDVIEWLIEPAPGTELPFRSGLIKMSGYPEAVPYVERIDWERWRFLDASETLMLVNNTSLRSMTFPENPEINPIKFHDNLPFDVRLHVPDSIAPQSWPQLNTESQWMLPVCVFPLDIGPGPAWQGGLGHDVLTFSTDGTVHALRSGLDLDWILEGATLVLSGQGRPETRIRLMGEDPWASAVSASCIDEDSATERTDVVRVTSLNDEVPGFEPPFRLISGRALQHYLPRLSLGPTWPPRSVYTVFDLEADGTGRTGSVEDPASGEAALWLPVEWFLTPDGLIEVHRESVDGSGSPQSRSWRLLRQQGDDLMVLESIYTGNREDLEGELRWPGRFNWFRRAAIPTG